MYLSASQTHALAETYRLLVTAEDLDELRQELGGPVTQLLQADSMVCRDIDPETSRYEIRVAHNMDAAHAQTYDHYYQFLDPVTPALKPLGCASFSQVFDMGELAKTEFFNDFLRPHNVYWGVNLYAYDMSRNVGDLLVFRSRQRPDFSANDLDILRMIEPALAAAYRRLEKKSGIRSGMRTVALDLDIAGVLIREAGLTKREADVSLHAARGDADKEIARKLNVEVTTVRYYLNNALRKLGVQGRRRLGAYFAEVVASGGQLPDRTSGAQVAVTH